MYFLDNYDFLEELIKDGQATNELFFKNGICLADNPINPNTIYVFRVESNMIWAVYGYTKKKNKAFLKFHKEVEKFMLSFQKPILRIGKNNDFKNHTVPVGQLNGQTVYQYVKKVS